MGANGGLVLRDFSLRRGKNLAHMEGEMKNSEGDLIATAKGTWAIWEARPKAHDE